MSNDPINLPQYPYKLIALGKGTLEERIKTIEQVLTMTGVHVTEQYYNELPEDFKTLFQRRDDVEKADDGNYYLKENKNK